MAFARAVAGDPELSVTPGIVHELWERYYGDCLMARARGAPLSVSVQYLGRYMTREGVMCYVDPELAPRLEDKLGTLDRVVTLGPYPVPKPRRTRALPLLGSSARDDAFPTRSRRSVEVRSDHAAQVK